MGFSFFPHNSIYTDKKSPSKGSQSKYIQTEEGPSNRAHSSEQGSEASTCTHKLTCSIAGLWETQPPPTLRESEVEQWLSPGNPTAQIPENPKAKHPTPVIISNKQKSWVVTRSLEAQPRRFVRI